MNTLTLCNLACSDKHIKKGFAGVFPSDALPQNKKSFYSYIVNLDSKHLPGSHWVGIFFKNKTVFYFDRYGIYPKNKHILKFLKRNSQIIKHNTVCFQGDFTSTCGYFCLYFLYQLSRNQNLKGLSFKNKQYNEMFIKQFVKNKFKVRKRVRSCSFNQGCIPLLNMTLRDKD